MTATSIVVVVPASTLPLNSISLTLQALPRIELIAIGKFVVALAMLPLATEAK